YVVLSCGIGFNGLHANGLIVQLLDEHRDGVAGFQFHKRLQCRAAKPSITMLCYFSKSTFGLFGFERSHEIDCTCSPHMRLPSRLGDTQEHGYGMIADLQDQITSLRAAGTR